MGKIKITEEAIAGIKQMRKNGAIVKDIAAKYNISESRTFQILRDFVPSTEKNRNCEYCGVAITNGDMCGSCYGKRKVVRKLVALGDVIRNCVEQERMQKDGC